MKFRAPLQETQRNGYQAALSPEDPQATFYFLAPAWRQNAIERETTLLERKPGFISWETVINKLANISEGTETERVWLKELIEAIRQEASLMHQPRQSHRVNWIFYRPKTPLLRLPTAWRSWTPCMCFWLAPAAGSRG